MEAGSADLNDVTITNKAKATLGAGSLKIIDSGLQLVAVVKAGSTKITHSRLHGASSINLAAGSLSMTNTLLNGYNLATTVGTISYHGRNRGRQFSYRPKAQNTLTAKAAVGSIKVN